MITSNPYVGTFTGRKVHFLNPHTDLFRVVLAGCAAIQKGATHDDN